MKKTMLLMTASVIAVSGGIIPSYVVAAESEVEASAAIEEIIIMGRKRQESLQDVPVSVQAYAGESIQEQGVVDLQALSTSVPNFSYSQSVGASDVLVMRGLGSVGSGPHLEQAVGQVFNGLFTTRSRLGRAALIDVAQVEVLRGPQGAIIGKNTSLGALVVSPNKPGAETEIILSGGYNFEASEGYEVQGILSGELSENVRARAVVNYKDMDGWMLNAPTGQTQRSREDFTGRLMVEWDVTENVTAEILYQHSDYHQVGKPREIFCLDPARVAANARFAGEDCEINGRNNSLAVIDGSLLGSSEDRVLEEGFDLTSDLVGLTLNWDIGNAVVTSVTGYSDYTMFDLFDSDLTAGGSRVIFNNEEYEQFSQELRIASSGRETFDYIAGANYFTSELDFTQDFDADAAGSRRRHEVANVQTDSFSLFGQVDWHISEVFDLTGGLRWTTEDREGLKDQWQNNIGTDVRNDAKCGGSGLTSCFVTPLAGKLDESNVSWNIAAKYNISDDSMFYISAATGFKSGGFNIRGNVANDAGRANFVFDNEESMNYEIGGKHQFLDNTVRFNWTVFRTEIDGLQLSSNDPVNISQAVVNGEAHSTGVEFDMLWAATDELTFGVTGAYSEARYDEFFGACYQIPSQTAAQGCNVDVGAPNTALDSNGDIRGDFQNLAGEQLPFAPDFTIVFTGEYRTAISDSLDISLKGKVYTVDEQSLDVTNHPIGEEDGYTKIDASITLMDPDGKWKVSLVGKNLTDKIVRSLSEPTTAFNAVGGAHYAFIDETRSIAVRAEFNF